MIFFSPRHVYTCPWEETEEDWDHRAMRMKPPDGFPDSWYHASNLQDQGVKIEYYVLVCHLQVGAPLYWRIFIFIYFAVLQILGIMLAFQTRRVKIRGLKDSTFVATNVYVSSIVIVIFILITFALRNYLNVHNTVLAVGICTLTTTFLSLTFIPKVCIH
jgi:gamma-aminobutyric acid type B receptor